VQQIVVFLQKNLDLSFLHISLTDSMIKAVAVIFLIFLLLLFMAQFRRHYVGWSLKGGIVGVFFGFLLALIIEGFLLIGGKTALTEILGWKNAPAPVAQALDAGRDKLINVLGITDQIPTSRAQGLETYGSVLSAFQSLNPQEAQRLKDLICRP
jgi:hypothetical protein